MNFHDRTTLKHFTKTNQPDPPCAGFLMTERNYEMALDLAQEYIKAGGDLIPEADLTPDFLAYRKFKQFASVPLARSSGCLDEAVSGMESVFAIDGLTEDGAAFLQGCIPPDPDYSDKLARLEALRPY